MTTADDIDAQPPAGSAGTSPDRASAGREAATAADAVGLQVVSVHTAQEAGRLVALFNQVWSVPDGSDIVNLGTMVALAHSGNYVVQARRDGALIGGAVGFFGPPGAPLHSHIVGVLPAGTAQGVGRALKLHQRAWCLDHGVDRMTWTYDPLVSRNAYFNIRKLGGLPIQYLQDFYGELSDGINTGQLSDRLLISWDLARSLAVSGEGMTQGALSAAERADVRELVCLAATDEAPGRFTPPPAGYGGEVLVGLPWDIEVLRRGDGARAAEWRLVVRQAFATLLADGWAVRDFRAGHYVFGREEDR